MRGVQLNSYQKVLALDEYYKLLYYVEELEQLNIPDVVPCIGCNSANTIVGKVACLCNDCNKVFSR
jgi:hypothetical protein